MIQPKSRKQLKDWVEITTSYLDLNNDYIQIYFKKDEEGYLLTDGGSTITGLIQEGCSLDNPKCQKLLQLTLDGYGITENNGRLQVRTTLDNFNLRKHSLLQAVLAFNRIGLQLL